MVERIDFEKGEVKRYGIVVPIQHWLTTIGTFLCIITGLILLLAGGVYGFIPGLAGRFAEYLNDPTLIKVHYVGAALIIGIVVFHVIYHGAKGHDSIIASKSDFKDSIAEIAAVMGVIGEGTIGGIKGLYLPRIIKDPMAMVLAKIGIREPPRAGKWLPIEKLEYTFAFSILFAVIIVTGFIKLFKVQLISIITPISYAHNVIYFASVLHGIATVILVPFVIIHIITAGMLPVSWPLFKAMLTTKVPLEYVKHHHEKWYEELMRERRR